MPLVIGPEETPSGARGQIALQFHPDWPFGDGQVIEGIQRDAAYHSQFVTGISNGGLTSFPGGDRFRWESRLFAGRYDGSAAVTRPVYGALERNRYAQGPALRFGSAFIRLRPEVTQRSSFCFPDSVFEPDLVVGPERIAVVEEVADVVESDDLDNYVEAHVHGGVRLDRDVEAIVLDPCFHNTRVEEIALSTGCAIEWHPGFRVPTADLDCSYRGEEFVRLAQSLGDELTPAVVGSAARSGHFDLQDLKRVWHLLARFGRVD